MRLIPRALVLARFAFCAFYGFCAFGAFGGCFKPDPPQLTPQKATVTIVSPVGIGMNVEFDAYNPNRVDISARSLTAKVTLNHKYEVGQVTSTKEITLPAGKHTDLAVPLSVAWTDLPDVAFFAATADNIPFDVDGTVALGNDVLHVDVPFHLEGTLTHQELLNATKRSLPQILPGLVPGQLPLPAQAAGQPSGRPGPALR